MNHIEQILEQEKNNDNHIHLYKVDRYWVAFERSAFYLFSVSQVDGVFKIRDSIEENTMLIAVLKEGFHFMNNPQLTIIKESDNEVQMGCRTVCKGFSHWKESLVSLFTKNLRISDNIQIHNLNILLNNN